MPTWVQYCNTCMYRTKHFGTPPNGVCRGCRRRTVDDFLERFRRAEGLGTDDQLPVQPQIFKGDRRCNT